MKRIILLIGLAISKPIFSQNVWTQKLSVPVSSISGGVSFGIGNKGYLVTGVDANGTGSNKLFEYDPAANTWTQKANFPGATRTDAVSFSIGNKGYVTTGTAVSNGSMLNDTWEYDQASDTWTQRASFTGTPRKYCTAFAINGEGYVGTGWDNTMSLKKDFFKYDPASNSWSPIPDFPFNRYGASGFAINNLGYVCTGNDGSGNNFPNDLWEYSSATNAWTQKADLPESGGTANAGRCYAFSFALGDYAFVGAGVYVNINMGLMPVYCQDFWEYSQAADSWTQKASFPGGNRQWTIGFNVGNKGYAGTGENVSNYYNDLFQYGDTTALPTGINHPVQQDNISVFPNPATDEITIKDARGKYLLHNALGEVIREFDVESMNVYTVNTSDISSGIYFLTCYASDHSIKRARLTISH